MATLAEIELDAQITFAAFADPACRMTWPARSAALRPRATDYARVFVGRIAAGVREYFDRTWSQSPVLAPDPGQTVLEVSVVWSQMVASAGSWPHGYRRLAEYLVPDVAWMRARFCRANEVRGRAFDGLVWIDDRWVWLPMPWGAAPLADAVSHWVD